VCRCQAENAYAIAFRFIEAEGEEGGSKEDGYGARAVVSPSCKSLPARSQQDVERRHLWCRLTRFDCDANQPCRSSVPFMVRNSQRHAQRFNFMQSTPEAGEELNVCRCQAE